MKRLTLTFLVAFLAINLSTTAQETQSVETTTNGTVTSFKLETNDVKEFSDINWDSVREIFEMNKPDDSITLSFKFKKPLQIGRATTESFNFKFEGKTSELEKLIANSKKTLATLIDIEGQKFD